MTVRAANAPRTQNGTYRFYCVLQSVCAVACDRIYLVLFVSSPLGYTRIIGYLAAVH